MYRALQLYVVWSLWNLEVNAYCTSSAILDESAECVFPSVDKKKAQVKQCLPSADGLWCPTTDSYCRDGRYKWCAATTTTVGGADPGKTCHFPFTFDKKTYSQCTTDGTHPDKVYFWCATQAEYKHNRWTKCKDVPEILPCQFSGKGHGIDKMCIIEHRQWKCQTPHGDKRTCPETDTTEGGNDPGKVCHFPFLHEGVRYNTCKIHDESDKYNWCSTTDNFDRDRLWTRCKEPYVFKLEGILLLLVIVAAIIVGACIFACLIYAVSETKHVYKCLTKRRKRNANKEESDNAREMRPLTPTAPPIEDAPPAYADVVKVLPRPFSVAYCHQTGETVTSLTSEQDNVVTLEHIT